MMNNKPRDLNILLCPNKFPALSIQFGGQEIINIDMGTMRTSSHINADQRYLK